MLVLPAGSLTPAEECPICDGAAAIDCPKCEGPERPQKKTPQGDRPAAKCEHCDRKGNADCDRCGGTGSADCAHCAGAARFRCPTCDGKGEVWVKRKIIVRPGVQKPGGKVGKPGVVGVKPAHWEREQLDVAVQEF